MAKTDFDYGSKQLARQKLLNFVIKHYTKNERKKLKMACLPGAQALDVYRVSDVLKIPRHNVTGIERDRKIYRELERQKLGIDLFHGTDNNFFETTDDRFDLINLDYCGMFTTGVAGTVSKVFGREVLKSPGVLCTNLYGARETSEVKDNYNVEFLSKARQDFTSSRLVLEKLAESLKFSADSIGASAADSLIKNMLYRNEQQHNARKEEAGKKPLESSRNNITSFIIHQGTTGNCTVLSEELKDVRHFEDVDTDSILHSLDVRFKGIPYEMRNYIIAKANKIYFCNDFESYKYISDDGSPMFTDMFLFDQHKDWFDEKRWPISFSTDNKGIFTVRIGDVKLNESTDYDNLLIRKILAHADKVSNYVVEVGGKRKERQFLGSSAKPFISPEKAREMIMHGVSTEYILKNYRGVTKQQLAAYKAWKTMEKH